MAGDHVCGGHHRRVRRCRPISTRFEPVPRLRSFDTDSSRIPSDLARRTRPVWQYQAVPALSALLPALTGVSRLRLRSAPTRLLRQPSEEVSHLLRFPAPHGAPAPRGALEAEPGAQVRRRPFTTGQVSSLHRAIAASSRSAARRAGTCTLHPSRCSSTSSPASVYSTRNRRLTSSPIRANVQHWSSQPQAAGPASSTASSSRTWAGVSLHRAPPAPFEASASRPPASRARRQRFAGIRLSRNRLATSRSLAPASISSAAASRTCSRRARTHPSPHECLHLRNDRFRRHHVCVAFSALRRCAAPRRGSCSGRILPAPHSRPRQRSVAHGTSPRRRFRR